MKKLVVCSILFLSNTLFAETETHVRLYRPFTAGVSQPPIQVTSILQGQCVQQSGTTSREDAWRCNAQSEEYDPCFLKPGQNKKDLYCPQTPWTGNAVQIQTRDAVSNEGFKTIDMFRGKPWAVEMDNGKRCLAIEESEFIDQQPITFVCQGEEYLLGKLQRCKSQWSVLWSNGTQIEERFIREVWY